jgi:hypothetical protein
MFNYPITPPLIPLALAREISHGWPWREGERLWRKALKEKNKRGKRKKTY